eukprot:GAHX01006770.1.p1 GENE.GAHX01006770.1~~GAHX01006770.1.p1  ORF type:complete len:58 (+),score=1.93 GAHX01006770.1:164-337(+)
MTETDFHSSKILKENHMLATSESKIRTKSTPPTPKVFPNNLYNSPDVYNSVTSPYSS